MRVAVVLLLFILIIVSSSIQTLSQPLPQTSLTCKISGPEYNALQSLYNSTNGPNWSSTCSPQGQQWQFLYTDYSAPCNGWYGITCNNNCLVFSFITLSCCSITP